MKKSVLALSVISALFLAGCSSDDDNEVVTPEPVESARDVTVNVSSIYGDLSTTPMNINSEEDIGPIAACNLAISKTSPSDKNGAVPFDLQYCIDGYTLTVEHEGGTFIKEDVILNEKQFIGNVTGKVTITVTHPELEGVDDAHYYTLSGSATLEANEVEVELITSNEDWSLVTVENNIDVDESRLNSVDMVSHDSLVEETITRSDFVLYTKSPESFLEIESERHGYGSANIETDTNRHYHLEVVINEDGEVIVDPGFSRDPIEVEPIAPVMEHNILEVSGLSNYSFDFLTGAVTYTIEEPNNRGTEAYSYTQISIADSKNTIADYSIEFDALTTRLDETTAFPTLSIYVAKTQGGGNNGNIYQNTNLKYFGELDENGVMLVVPYTYVKNGNSTVPGKWVGDMSNKLPITEYNEYYVSSTWGEDATQGNFYIRYNDESANTGATVIITKHEFSLIPEEQPE